MTNPGPALSAGAATKLTGRSLAATRTLCRVVSTVSVNGDGFPETEYIGC